MDSAAPVERFRSVFNSWLRRHREEISAHREVRGTIQSELTHTQWLFGCLWEAGFTRWGWPSSAGGREGSPLLRAIVAEEMCSAGLTDFNTFVMPEVLAAPFATEASPELVEEYLEAYLSGAAWWCQGFSEPNAGSDLGSLTTKAVRRGDTFVVNGQKVWTTTAQFAQHCVLLVRTGSTDSKARGLTVLFVDMDSPGIHVHPLRTVAGDEHFCEVYFDDVEVPTDRVVGSVNGGWSVAARILMCERSTVFWARAAWLSERFRALLDLEEAHLNTDAVGRVYQLLASLRARSRATQYAVAEGRLAAAESSIDKVLVALSEQVLYDTALQALDESLLFGVDGASESWRSEYLYSRAATIYGGAVEIQRDIIAEKLLGLPRA
jgi:alkylation response protein AidB-like acyl-CoA dehydrogenase